jgi:acylphosphatase
MWYYKKVEKEESGKKRIHMIISGLVQGVFFRYETEKKAKELGLTGWVKNRSDGNVEIIAEGENENLLKLKEWTNGGPSYAKITKVISELKPSTGEFKDFEVKY